MSACVVILFVVELCAMASVCIIEINAIYKKIFVNRYCRLTRCWVFFGENVKGGAEAIDSECVQCSQSNDKDKFFHIEEYKKNLSVKNKIRRPKPPFECVPNP
jgi:hypothetical protein